MTLYQGKIESITKLRSTEHFSVFWVIVLVLAGEAGWFAAIISLVSKMKSLAGERGGVFEPEYFPQELD